jgi:hypothetical protein
MSEGSELLFVHVQKRIFKRPRLPAIRGSIINAPQCYKSGLLSGKDGNLSEEAAYAFQPNRSLFYPLQNRV